MPRKPRENKTKGELLTEIEQKQKAERLMTLAKLVFPFIEGLPSVYDAQTALYAVAGFIEGDLAIKETQHKVAEINYDLSKTPEGDIKVAVQHLFALLENEGAKESAKVLRTMGDKLNDYLVMMHRKDAMMKQDDFIK